MPAPTEPEPDSMADDLDPRPPEMVQRVWESIQRDELPPQDDRGRMRVVMNNLVLHLHPSKVAKPTLKFTYTWGLGGLALLLVMLLAATGVMLMFVYTPSPQTAYQDMLNLQTNIWYGQLVRNLHHWSGNLLLVVAVLHLLRVFFTGGFRTPREFNWILGISLLLLIVGEGLRSLLLGGPEVSAATLTNFYGLHVAIIPLTLMGIVSFHIWRVRKDTLTIPHRLDGSIDGGSSPQVEKVTTLPHLVSRELVFALVMTGAILLWSVWVNAPLEAAANPDHSPNPAKAAWYFMGLQELLLHFHPVFGAIIIPALGLGALAFLPYQRFDLQAEGVWFRSRKGRWMALVGALSALVAVPALVLLDEYWLDLPALLPSLPPIISNGWLPLAALLLLLIAYYEGVRRLFKATACETRQSLFVLLLTAFVVLTVIGVAFRGPGMALMLPWEVL
jgi:quinol-cytochrome oxidoreductase complex cytochrome b subunit